MGTAQGLEDSVYKHFIEWGEIEYCKLLSGFLSWSDIGISVRVLTGRGVAFVRYKSRVTAEFAKEAMNCQAMDDNEILNVRWATEDPNPKGIYYRQS